MARVTPPTADLIDYARLVPGPVWAALAAAWMVAAVVVGLAAGRTVAARDRQVPRGSLNAGPGFAPRPGAGTTTWLCEHGGPNARHLGGCDCPPPLFTAAEQEEREGP